MKRFGDLDTLRRLRQQQYLTAASMQHLAGVSVVIGVCRKMSVRLWDCYFSEIRTFFSGAGVEHKSTWPFIIFMELVKLMLSLQSERFEQFVKSKSAMLGM